MSGSLSGALSGSLDDVTRDLERTLQASNDVLAHALRDLSALPGIPPAAARDVGASPAAAKSRSLRDAGVAELAALLEPKGAPIHQSASFTFSSPFIMENPAYARRIASVQFVYKDGDLNLNAYATDGEVTLEDGRKVAPPVIVYLAGLDIAVRLAAVALAAHLAVPDARPLARAGSMLADAFRRIGEVVSSTGCFDPASSLRIFEQSILAQTPELDGQAISLARSYVAAMESFVIAHEAGHIALGHTLGYRQNLDVSRNQEREADSFAASTLSTSPFREYLFLGSVFVTIIFAWTEAAAGSHAATTHPLGRERFFNVLRSNSASAEEAARRFGLTAERLTELLPAV